MLLAYARLARVQMEVLVDDKIELSSKLPLVARKGFRIRSGSNRQ
jgi:hypothetical protein